MRRASALPLLVAILALTACPVPDASSPGPGSDLGPLAARPEGAVPPTLTVPSPAPVADVAAAEAAIVAWADAEAGAYAELLELHSAGGTRPLFASDVTLGDDAFARVVQAQQAVLAASDRFEAALALLERAGSAPAARRVLGTPGQRRVNGLVSKVFGFMGWAKGSGPRTREAMVAVMTRLDGIDRIEAHEYAREALGDAKVGASPQAFLTNLREGKLDAHAPALHQHLYHNAPGYGSAADDARATPEHLAAKEGGLGLSAGVDVMIETTNVMLPGFNRAKKLADALKDPLTTNTKEWVKSKVPGLNADATATRIGQEAADFMGGMRVKAKGPTRGKLVVTVGDAPPGALPAEVSTVVVTNRDTGRIHIATGDGSFVLPPGTYDIYTVGKGGKVAVDQGAVVTADAETVVASAIVPPPITGSVTTGFLDGWALLPVTIYSAKLTRDEWVEGWRNNGQSWVATAQAGVTMIEADIVCKGPAWSYEDYMYDVAITAVGAETRSLAAEKGTIPKDGGSKRVSVMFNPRQEVAWFGQGGTVRVVVSLTGGNPEFSTRYSRGEISFVWP